MQTSGIGIRVYAFEGANTSFSLQRLLSLDKDLLLLGFRPGGFASGVVVELGWSHVIQLLLDL